MKKKNKKCKCGSDYDVDVKMSVPEGMDFNTLYTMSSNFIGILIEMVI